MYAHYFNLEDLLFYFKRIEFVEGHFTGAHKIWLKDTRTEMMRSETDISGIEMEQNRD